jgi:predicted nucleotidyltransferase
LCRRHHIRRLSLFGSVLRDDFRPDSDVDLLVEFEPEHVPGFIRLHGIAEDFSRVLGGRAIDLVTREALSPRIRESVLASSEVAYAEG